MKFPASINFLWDEAIESSAFVASSFCFVQKALSVLVSTFLLIPLPCKDFISFSLVESWPFFALSNHAFGDQPLFSSCSLSTSDWSSEISAFNVSILLWREIIFNSLGFDFSSASFWILRISSTRFWAIFSSSSAILFSSWIFWITAAFCPLGDSACSLLVLSRREFMELSLFWANTRLVFAPILSLLFISLLICLFKERWSISFNVSISILEKTVGIRAWSCLYALTLSYCVEFSSWTIETRLFVLFFNSSNCWVCSSTTLLYLFGTLSASVSAVAHL